MPVGVVDDGNFKFPAQNGAISFSYPFAESRNDFETFIASRVMRVDGANWRKPVPMAQKSFGIRGTGYLVGVSEPTPVEGTSIVEYTERYAPIPARQTIYQSASASIQYIHNAANDGDPPRYLPIPISDVFDGVYYYDYFLESNPLPALFKTKLVQFPYQIADALQLGVEIKNPPRDGLYLAQNSTTSVWMGGILCRESIYVKPPPIQKWKGSF